MKEQQENREAGTDRNLDIPSEANTGKHVNFREEEDDNGGAPGQEVGDRRRQWEEGLNEGREQAENEKRDSTPERHGNSSIPADENETLGTP